MTIREAIQMAYTGKCNMVTASSSCDTNLATFKRLLAEKVRRTPIQLETQLALKL